MVKMLHPPGPRVDGYPRLKEKTSRETEVLMPNGVKRTVDKGKKSHAKMKRNADEVAKEKSVRRAKYEIGKQEGGSTEK